MVDTGFAPFTATVDKTNHVLREIEDAFGWPKQRRHESYAALRAVLHTLRDRLTVDEAAHVAAQLPVLIRGIYYEGWDPSRAPQKMNAEQFLDRVQREFRHNVNVTTQELVRAVIAALRHHLTAGEWHDVTSSLPDALVSVLTPASTK